MNMRCVRMVTVGKVTVGKVVMREVTVRIVTVRMVPVVCPLKTTTPCGVCQCLRAGCSGSGGHQERGGARHARRGRAFDNILFPIFQIFPIIIT